MLLFTPTYLYMICYCGSTVSDPLFDTFSGFGDINRSLTTICWNFLYCVSRDQSFCIAVYGGYPSQPKGSNLTVIIWMTFS